LETFPAFFPLAGARVVVAGEGEAAEAKARLFEGSPARVDRVFGAAAAEATSYAGARLAFIAGPRAFVSTAAAAARAAGAAVNVVDHPGLCDFHTPAIVDRGQVVAAVGTAGAAPMLASLLRAELEQRLAPGVGALAALLAGRRDALREAFPDLAERRAALRRILLGPAAAAAEAGDEPAALALIDAALAQAPEPAAVAVIERPAAPDLFSLRALRALSAADIVAFEPGDEPLVRSHARRDVERTGLGEPAALARAAQSGRLVVVIAPDPASLTDALAAAGAAVRPLRSAS
jgi:precorrin-2 dehydrogenase/sirohydrochlorin ferrochelatase